MSSVSRPAGEPALPDPGEDLINRVTGEPDRPWFYASGEASVRELDRTLGIAGRSLDSFESMLDFGCGCGRMLLWMESYGAAHSLHGTDIDEEAIAWCRAHIPYAQFAVNQADPPLPYRDGQFDLVFNHSVFTHLDERRQDLWLTELQRVTRPGGLLVLSVHGERTIPDDAWDIRERLEHDGIVYLDTTYPSDYPLPDWYQTTYHAPWYIFEHWSWWFDIRAYVPGGDLDRQDHILLERRVEDKPRRAPLVARPRRAAVETGVIPTRLPADVDTDVVAARAAARRFRSGDDRSPSKFGPVGRLSRKLALRMMRPYSFHEDRFDDAVAMNIEQIRRALDHHESLLKALAARNDESP